MTIMKDRLESDVSVISGGRGTRSRPVGQTIYRKAIDASSISELSALSLSPPPPHHQTQKLILLLSYFESQKDNFAL